MTLQEIQYKAQAIMQKWRDDDSAPYVEFVEELALMDVPELPEGLEEAAQHDAMLTYKMPEDGDFEKANKTLEARIFHEIGFKAGAEWMAGQGETIEGQVAAIGEKRWVDLDDSTIDKQLASFMDDDKVIVQIRKK